MPIAELIDKKDNWEICRDEIAAILARETLSQQALAQAAGKNPDLWKFDVLIEKTRPFESLDDDDFPVFPLVNISFESLTNADRESQPALVQIADPAVYNIDIWAIEINVKKSGTGYQSADRQAVLSCQRIVRLVRNILYSVPADSIVAGDDYTYLNLRGIVGYRKIRSINMFEPKYDQQGVTVSTARIQLEVKLRENSLEGPYHNLELLQAQTTVDPDGIVNFQFDYP